MALANVGGSNEHPRKLRRDPLRCSVVVVGRPSGPASTSTAFERAAAAAAVAVAVAARPPLCVSCPLSGSVWPFGCHKKPRASGGFGALRVPGGGVAGPFSRIWFGLVCGFKSTRLLSLEASSIDHIPN
jgi:hypothetical protein